LSPGAAATSIADTVALAGSPFSVALAPSRHLVIASQPVPDGVDFIDLSPPCVADFDDGSGTGTPDGGVGIEDLLYYLTVYNAGVLRADVDDGSGTGTHDGGVGIEDLLYFLVRYNAGC